jgi:hypothetical protein
MFLNVVDLQWRITQKDNFFTIFEKKNKKMGTGTKNVVAIKKATEKIEVLTKQFKLKRIGYEEFVKSMNECMSEMSSKRDYIEYMKNIGYFEKFSK